MEELVTIREVAEYLQISKDRVYRLAKEESIPVSRIENQWRFRLEDIKVWLEEKKAGIFSKIGQSESLDHSNQADPFLKWAGGKGQLLEQYESFFPYKFSNYLEPFVGGGRCIFPSSQ